MTSERITEGSHRLSVPRRFRLPQADRLAVYDGGVLLVPMPELRAAPVPCSSALKVTSGSSLGEFQGSATHSSSGSQYVVCTCLGLGIGSIVQVGFTQIADGHSFKGWQQFCFASKCSNGASATMSVTLAGEIRKQDGGYLMAMDYECYGMCGNIVICREEGTFDGHFVASAGPDPLNGNYSGKGKWTLACCPDVVWDI